MNTFEKDYEEARKAFDAGRYTEAHTLFRRLLEGHSEGYAEIHNKMGIMAHHNGDTENAIVYFKKALEINPHYTEASLNLTITYNDIGEYDKAIHIFSQAADFVQKERDKIDPYIQGKLANEHAKLGTIYFDSGLLNDAEEQFRKALSMRKNFVDVLTHLGITLREKGMWDDAIGCFLKAKKIKPNYTRAMIHLGITYYMKGFSDLALQEWEEVKRISPDGKEAQVYLSLAKKEVVEKE